MVFIPGFLDTPRLFHRMEPAVRAAGYRTAILPLRPNTGARRFEALAEDLGRLVGERFPGERVSLVGFSMGGIVARVWAQAQGGRGRVERLIALETPHHGTLWASLLPLAGMRQLRRGSPFLAALNQDRASLLACGIASIWSPVDYMVIPAASARLGFGDERRVFVPIHAWLPRSRRVIREVLGLLGG